MTNSSMPDKWIPVTSVGLNSNGTLFRVRRSFRAAKINPSLGWHIAAIGHGEETLFQPGDIGICYAARANGTFFLGFGQDRRRPPSASMTKQPTSFAVCIVCGPAHIDCLESGA
ncbi:MAG: hypothetical protein IT456_04875 [Planctomycetes bacterium]|nr:hypothetical protein [Planctomycetota bacterium]